MQSNTLKWYDDYLLKIKIKINFLLPNRILLVDNAWPEILINNKILKIFQKFQTKFKPWGLQKKKIKSIKIKIVKKLEFKHRYPKPQVKLRDSTAPEGVLLIKPAHRTPLTFSVIYIVHRYIYPKLKIECIVFKRVNLKFDIAVIDVPTSDDTNIAWQQAPFLRRIRHSHRWRRQR